jgi:hypothetical protein
MAFTGRSSRIDGVQRPWHAPQRGYGTGSFSDPHHSIADVATDTGDSCQEGPRCRAYTLLIARAGV